MVQRHTISHLKALIVDKNMEDRGVAALWACHAPFLQEFFCPLSGLSNEVLYVFVPFLLFKEIKFKFESMEFFLTLHHKSKRF